VGHTVLGGKTVPEVVERDGRDGKAGSFRVAMGSTPHAGVKIL